MNNKFELGDLVRFKNTSRWGSGEVDTHWWGYVCDDQPNGHHIYVYWFFGGPSQFDPFHAAELKDDIVIVAKA